MRKFVTINLQIPSETDARRRRRRGQRVIQCMDDDAVDRVSGVGQSITLSDSRPMNYNTNLSHWNGNGRQAEEQKEELEKLEMRNCA